MREIKVCPSLLLNGFDGYSTQAAKVLFDGARVSPFLEFDFEKGDIPGLGRKMEALSISGAQEKYAAVIDSGRIRLATEKERSTHILKPAPIDKISERKQIPANEHLTMQIASQVYGISTAANGLCFSSDNQPVYITRRYDVLSDGSKLKQEEVCSLVGRNEQVDGSEYKYDGSYKDIADVIRRVVPAWPVAMERYFRLVVFNYIFCNSDAHLKNFSLLYIDNDVMLAPAYDLINTEVHLHNGDFGLKMGLAEDFHKSDVYEKTGHPCQDDFRLFGRMIGISDKRIEMVISQFLALPDEVNTLVEKSFLNSDSIKRKYLRLVKERMSRFKRLSTEC